MAGRTWTSSVFALLLRNGDQPDDNSLSADGGPRVVRYDV